MTNLDRHRAGHPCATHEACGSCPARPRCTTIVDGELLAEDHRSHHVQWLGPAVTIEEGRPLRQQKGDAIDTSTDIARDRDGVSTSRPHEGVRIS